MKKTIILGSMALGLTACKKESSDPTTGGTTAAFETHQVLHAFAQHVAQANYADLAARSEALRDAIVSLSTTVSDADLNTCKQLWRDTRTSWERSEALLFGPVATENIDPRIDTWPVDFTDLDAQLNSGNAFTPEYITALEDALKGFHPIEYLLFGLNGEKTASELTPRQLEYLVALANDLATLTGSLNSSWVVGTEGNYSTILTGAGHGSTVYPTERAAYEEIVNAMIGICDEVANGKMGEVLLAQDPMLEESPFAKNSITDFTNNIKGVQNVYLGQYDSDGVGMENFVREHSLQLDNTIKQQLAASLTALNNISMPFGQAIIQQPVLVQQAIDAINALATTLNDALLPLVQQHVN